MDKESRQVAISLMFVLGGALGFYFAPLILRLLGN